MDFFFFATIKANFRMFNGFSAPRNFSTQPPFFEDIHRVKNFLFLIFNINISVQMP